MTNLAKHNKKLFSEIKQLIDESRLVVSQTVNSVLTATYWNIGKKINDEILKHQRAEYGGQIIATLSQQLIQEFGKSFTEKNLRRMLQFNEIFPDFEIVASVMRQISWTHFTLLIPIKTDLERDFYTKYAVSKIGVCELCVKR